MAAKRWGRKRSHGPENAAGDLPADDFDAGAVRIIRPNGGATRTDDGPAVSTSGLDATVWIDGAASPESTVAGADVDPMLSRGGGVDRGAQATGVVRVVSGDERDASVSQSEVVETGDRGAVAALNWSDSDGFLDSPVDREDDVAGAEFAGLGREDMLPSSASANGELAVGGEATAMRSEHGTDGRFGAGGVDPLVPGGVGAEDDEMPANADSDRESGDGVVKIGGAPDGLEGGGRFILPTDQESTDVGTAPSAEDRPTVVINDEGGSGGSAEQAPSPRRGMHPRFRERRKAIRRSLGRRRIIGLLIGVVFLLAVLVIGALLGSNLFVVKSADVEIIGWEHADMAQVSAVIDDVVGVPVLRVDEQAVVDQLEAIAWVDEAKVSTNLPNGLLIEISERTPQATFRGGDGRYRIIDREGRVLDIVDGYPVEFVWVTTAAPPNLQVGEFAPKGFSAAAQLSTRFNSALRPRVQRIAVEPSGDAVVLYLKDGSRVNFGAASDLLIKLVRLDTLMTDFPLMSQENIDVSTEETTRASDALLQIKEAERAAKAAEEEEARAEADAVAAAEASQTEAVETPAGGNDAE